MRTGSDLQLLLHLVLCLQCNPGPEQAPEVHWGALRLHLGCWEGHNPRRWAQCWRPWGCRASVGQPAQRKEALGLFLYCSDFASATLAAFRSHFLPPQLTLVTFWLFPEETTGCSSCGRPAPAQPLSPLAGPTPHTSAPS